MIRGRHDLGGVGRRFSGSHKPMKFVQSLLSPFPDKRLHQRPCFLMQYFRAQGIRILGDPFREKPRVGICLPVQRQQIFYAGDHERAVFVAKKTVNGIVDLMKVPGDPVVLVVPSLAPSVEHRGLTPRSSACAYVVLLVRLVLVLADRLFDSLRNSRHDSLHQVRNGFPGTGGPCLG